MLFRDDRRARRSTIGTVLRTKTAPPVALVALLLFVSSPGPGAERAPLQPAPVVVELFTSQGCSSCPPADELLRRIGREPGVLALSFHVDYWNRLGWNDPFSDHRWSERQDRHTSMARGSLVRNATR